MTYLESSECLFAFLKALLYDYNINEIKDNFSVTRLQYIISSSMSRLIVINHGILVSYLLCIIFLGYVFSV